MKSTSQRTPSASKWLVGSSNSRRFAWRAATVLNRLPPNPKMMKIGSFKGRENRKWLVFYGVFIFGGLRGKNDRKAPYFMVKTHGFPVDFLRKWIQSASIHLPRHSTCQGQTHLPSTAQLQHGFTHLVLRSVMVGNSTGYCLVNVNKSYWCSWF
jgi:hypothetical protein